MIKVDVRNDITLNYSGLFYRCFPTYIDDEFTGWYIASLLSYEEYKMIIDDICKLFVEDKNLVCTKLSDIYPVKSTEKYRKMQVEMLNDQGIEIDKEVINNVL